MTWPGPGAVTIRGHGIVLREWTDHDMACMTQLFDESSIDAWTPLESPFNLGAAGRYLARARQRRDTGSAVQLAITIDGCLPRGEVILFPGQDGWCEIAYAVGIDYRGQCLAARAVRAAMEHCLGAGLTQFRMRISPDNLASQKVAETCGFQLSADPLVQRVRKGRRLELATWEFG